MEVYDTISDIRYLEKYAYNFSIEYNDHKSFYLTMQEWIDAGGPGEGSRQDVSSKLREELIQADKCWRVQVYPLSPSSFYLSYGVTFEEAIADAAQWLRVRGCDGKMLRAGDE